MGHLCGAMMPSGIPGGFFDLRKLACSMALIHVLANLYQTNADIRTIVNEVGLKVEQIKFDDKALNIWSNVVREAEADHKLWRLLAVAQDAYPDNVDLQQAIERRLTRSHEQSVVKMGNENHSYTIRERIEEMYEFQQRLALEVSNLRHKVLGELTPVLLHYSYLKEKLEGLQRLLIIAGIVGVVMYMLLLMLIWFK